MTVSNYSSGEQMSGGYFVGYTTATVCADNGGSKGSEISSYSTAFCIGFEDQIRTPATYLVEAQNVGSGYNASYNPLPGSKSTTVTKQKLEDDAVLELLGAAEPSDAERGAPWPPQLRRTGEPRKRLRVRHV